MWTSTPRRSFSQAFYVCFVTLCLFNVVTAIFVESALSITKQDRETLSKHAQALEESAIAELRKHASTV